MLKFKTATNVALYTAGEIIPRVLAFFLLPILTKYLTPGDYGISGYINTVTTFLYVFTALSVNVYALRTYYKVTSTIEKKQLIGNIFLFLVGWGFIMLCLEILFFPYLLNKFSIKVSFYPYFLLGLIINFFDVISIIPLVAYRVNEDAKSFVLLSVGRTILQYLLTLIMIVYFKMGLLGSFLGRLYACIPFAVIYFIVIKRKGIFSINLAQIKDALQFSLPLLPGALSYLVISVFDRVILERYVTLSQLGIYSVASTLALTLNIVIQGLYRSFEQKIFREHSNEGFINTVDKLYKVYIAFLYVPAFAITLFTSEILHFFTSSSQYYAAGNYIVYLIVSVIISGINIFLGTLLIANNRRRIVTFSSFASAIVSLIVNLLLIKYYGVLGACIASILSFLVVCIFYFSKVFLLNKYLWQQILFVIIFFACAYFMPSAMPLMLLLAIKFLLVIAFIMLVAKTINLKLLSLTGFKPFEVFVKRQV